MKETTNYQQKGWFMRKRGKQFIYGCALAVLLLGPATQLVKADVTLSATDETTITSSDATISSEVTASSENVTMSENSQEVYEAFISMDQEPSFESVVGSEVQEMSETSVEIPVETSSDSASSIETTEEPVVDSEEVITTPEVTVESRPTTTVEQTVESVTTTTLSEMTTSTNEDKEHSKGNPSEPFGNSHSEIDNSGLSFEELVGEQKGVEDSVLVSSFRAELYGDLAKTDKGVTFSEVDQPEVLPQEVTTVEPIATVAEVIPTPVLTETVVPPVAAPQTEMFLTPELNTPSTIIVEKSLQDSFLFDADTPILAPINLDDFIVKADVDNSGLLTLSVPKLAETVSISYETKSGKKIELTATRLADNTWEYDSDLLKVDDEGGLILDVSKLPKDVALMVNAEDGNGNSLHSLNYEVLHTPSRPILKLVKKELIIKPAESSAEMTLVYQTKSGKKVKVKLTKDKKGNWKSDNDGVFVSQKSGLTYFYPKVLKTVDMVSISSKSESGQESETVTARWNGKDFKLIEEKKKMRPSFKLVFNK